MGALLKLATTLAHTPTEGEPLPAFVRSVAQAVGADAVVLLRLVGDVLFPVASTGLTADSMGRSFPLEEHPRLQRALAAKEPTQCGGSPTPDPFDGLLERDPGARLPVHACVVCPLLEGGRTLGALTLDALNPGAFDRLDAEDLALLASLATMALQANDLRQSLSRSHERAPALIGVEEQPLDVGRLHGEGPAMQGVRAEIALVARSDFTVLVTGETGVGKELVCRGLHRQSKRASGPLVYVNCAALPLHLAESELFGHVRGAFTGAETDRRGKFEVADGGTLFLDEICELPLIVQPKLLRALQSGEIQRVGADETRAVDVRVLAATNRDVVREVEEGRFRADLYHRLDGYRIYVPPLRERREDIPLLMGLLGERHQRRLGVGPVRFTESARELLCSLEWKGNVRELDHALGQAILRSSARSAPRAPVIVDAADCQPGVPVSPVGSSMQPEVRPLREAVEDFKRDLIRRAVAAHDGNWAAAARALGMHRSNLHHLAERLGLRGAAG